MAQQGIIGGLICILIGLFTLICTIKKPNFFWENRKALRMRRLIGDKITSIFYIIIGAFALGGGTIALLGGIVGAFAG
ncbi:hypothetical protein [Tepidibacter hydrothermalis]|uniref:Uncharacterized protein n=1 Tax=Tepidibacter hydrothermalis TaxID=3036126 RepID=A0ABY8EAK7_9FIRM|nr:hypothetical protein [Tepidibacter hydrothermalis]WFD08950.1 hypothetical protein P4S50_11175 [Tepidibacter hydrothermalis]